MEGKLNILITGKDPSLQPLILHSSLVDSYDIYFSESLDSLLDTVRNNNISIVLLNMDRDLNRTKNTLKELKAFDSLLAIIIVGETLPSEDVMEIIRCGAKDYLVKPLKLDFLQKSLMEIEEKISLRKETFRLEKRLEKKYSFQGIIGKSPYMLEIFSLIEKVAKHFTTILISGETGTGKELIAQSIQKLNQPLNPTLILCDSASIPDNLFESELFGYIKGAFTGADRDKKGLFEEAHKGVIFLDELAEVPLHVQSKLLRVLDYHQFRPLGSNITKTVDVKVIAITNRDLRDMVRRGLFREDLYHRLNKLEIHIPPLRERREDIPLLVRYFLALSRKRLSKNLKGISRQAQKVFLQYEWPGNVRELKNVIESAALMAKKDFLDISDLPKYLQKTSSSTSRIPLIDRTRLTTLDELEKEYISHLLKITENNLRKTAGILKISRTTLYNKLKKYEIPIRQ